MSSTHSINNAHKWYMNIWVRRVFLLVADAICVFAAYLCTLLFRFGGRIPSYFITAFLSTITHIILIYFIVNWLFRLYASLWEHAGLEELMYVFCSSFIATALCYALAFFLKNPLPRSVYIAAGLVIILLEGGLRMAYRLLRRLRVTGRFSHEKTPALIIGAGDAGASLVAQMLENRTLDVIPVAIVDDDPEKKNQRVHGIRVMGTTQDIPAIVRRYQIKQVIFAMPTADSVARRHILEICTRTGCEMKIIPTMEAMLEGGGVGQMRDVNVADLLDRPQVKLDMAAVSSYLSGSTVLVTGGGGSIGSELCRQIAKFKPKKIIIFDIYENNAFDLMMELRGKYGKELDVEVAIGSVRDVRRVDEVFAVYKPDVVFHAAAHKHVPLMETSPAEAVKNNVDGTFHVAKGADIAGVKRFVLISTDKAVNPTNIMGASKYLCELIVQYMNQKSRHTSFVTVRFGNVLGSNGSVLPLFRRQIAAGGPVTVTHKDVTRYFMTIPEAAQLVIQAGSMAKQGEVFLLDMGDPVRIDDFARTLIRLSGYEPDVDIMIQYTGLRPGEKMYEELLQESETQGKSDFPGILIGKTHPLSADEILTKIDRLRAQVAADPDNTHKYIAEAVPTYHAPGSEKQQQKEHREKTADKSRTETKKEKPTARV